MNELRERHCEYIANKLRTRLNGLVILTVHIYFEIQADFARLVDRCEKAYKGEPPLIERDDRCEKKVKTYTITYIHKHLCVRILEISICMYIYGFSEQSRCVTTYPVVVGYLTSISKVYALLGYLRLRAPIVIIVPPRKVDAVIAREGR